VLTPDESRCHGSFLLPYWTAGVNAPGGW
jgi:hypothetical protein